MAHLSVSQFHSILRCGEQMRLERSGFPVLPAVYLAGGTAYHSATEEIDRALFGGSVLNEAWASHAWKTNWTSELAKCREQDDREELWRKGGRASAALPNREDVAFWKAKGEEMVLAYLKYRLASDWSVWELPDGSPAIEIGLEMQLGDATIRGFIDRVMVTPTGELIVRDLKTGRKPESNLQLGTYALMVEHEFGVRPRWGDYFMAREGKPTQAIDLEPYTEEYLTTEYNKVHLMRKHGLYLANEGRHCFTCAVKEACRLKGEPEVIAQWSDKVPSYEEEEKSA